MSLRILIVDDSPVMRSFIRRVIELAGVGYSLCLEAGNGTEALEHLSVQEVDLVLCDVNMPGMNGEEFVRRLYDVGLLPRLPVIVVSTDSTVTRVSQMMQLGARGYVRKPFTPEALRAALDQALKPNAQEELRHA